MAASEAPMYEHDCDDCIFLGRADGRELYNGVEVVDLYYCPNSWEHGSYVMRTGNDGPEYQSGPLANGTGWGPNDEVYRRARERGLVEEFGAEGLW
jgi:hypothetical protein